MLHTPGKRKPASNRRSRRFHPQDHSTPVPASGMPQRLTQNADQQTAFLNNPHISIQMRRDLAQQIGQTHGNHYLQRMLDVQREADPMLRPGSRGDAVTSLQQLLVESGANIDVDGIFGPGTQRAVVAFQRAAGLSPDGIVGPQTWSKLHTGGITIPSTGGTNPAAAKLVLAKLSEVKLLMKKLSSSAPAPNPPATTDTTVVIPPVEHQHDSENGEEESWWDQAKDAAGSAVNSVSETANDAWNSVTQTAGEVVNDVSEAAGDAWNTVKQTANTAGGIVGGIVDDTKEKVGGIVQDVQQTVNSGLDKVVKGVSDVASDVGKSIEDFGNDLSVKYADEIASVKEFVNDVQHYLNNPEDALRKLDEILNGLKKKAGELLGDEDEDIPDRITGTVDPVESTAQVHHCHDAPAHEGRQRRKLVPSLNLTAEHRQEMPTSGPVNHDSVRPTMSYANYITTGDAEIATVPSGDFGTTGGKIKIDQVNFVAEHFTDFVTVSARLFHTISSDITNRPGRKDVKPDLDIIDETNWKQAADDLDPDLHKSPMGAPLRKDFWASDITMGHEKFHANDTDKHVQTVVTPAIQAELSKRDVTVDWLFWRETNLKKDLHAIMAEMVAKATEMKNAYMTPPASEQRAYGADEPKYRERAAAIRKKAKDNGWA